MSATAPSAASWSGAPRQWNATIAPLSSRRTRSRRASAVSSELPNSRTRRAHSATAGSSLASVHPGRSCSAPWEPRYVIVPIDTIARASDARRPVTHATSLYVREIAISRWRVDSGTCASEARSTIGASVPSMSSMIAAASGLDLSGTSASAGSASVTPSVCPLPRARRHGLRSATRRLRRDRYAQRFRGSWRRTSVAPARPSRRRVASVGPPCLPISSPRSWKQLRIRSTHSTISRSRCRA